MFIQTKRDLQLFISNVLSKAYPDADLGDIILEFPSDKTHGDISTNIAMRSAKIFKKNPLRIAEECVSHLKNGLKEAGFDGIIDDIQVKAPGFINFYCSQAYAYYVLETVLKDKVLPEMFEGVVHRQKIQIEFVSANPTGPLSVAHARQAAVGDCLGNIFKALGHEVTKEYYVNDGGNQIHLLGRSLEFRCREFLGVDAENEDDFYQGEYLKDLAEDYCTAHQIKAVDQLDLDALRIFAKDTILDMICAELSDFGVVFDEWSFESQVASQKKIQNVLQLLKDKGFIYEKDGAAWFRTTDFGDDKDRVVQKTDGSYTYLTPDIVYHKDKFDRGFDQVIDILGPDHHGYIARLKAAARAIGKDADQLQVLIVQLATIFRDGQEVSMSTRKGEFISLREVMDEVGVDAARYFFLMRNIKQHLEFDLELAKQQTSENPIYYIQYAHARMCSILGKARDAGVKSCSQKFTGLKEAEELDLIKKLSHFQQTLLVCASQYDPYALGQYMMELAGVFHKFYDKHHVLGVKENVSQERLALVKASQMVLAHGLTLLGCSAPESM